MPDSAEESQKAHPTQIRPHDLGPSSRINVAPVHGWRHRYKTVGMEAGIPQRVLDAIQGHAARTASYGYGEVTRVQTAHAHPVAWPRAGSIVDTNVAWRICRSLDGASCLCSERGAFGVRRFCVDGASSQNASAPTSSNLGRGARLGSIR
jgi:hypothetical protein